MSKTPEFRPSNEDLLGYLLGALDPDEQRRVAQYIDDHPEVRGELDRLQACLKPLQHGAIPVEPPGGLAQRTCSSIFAHGDGWVSPRHVESADQLESNGWRVWDLTMFMAVMVLMAMLVTPAIYNSRESARRLSCASNLRHLSHSLVSYSLQNGDRFPLMPSSGPGACAGSYAIILKDDGYLTLDEMILCPATESIAFLYPFSIPTMATLAHLGPVELTSVQRRCGGAYGYHIGEFVNGVMVASVNRNRSNFALMSDAPEHARGLGLVARHPGNGRNVLFESGRIEFVRPICQIACDVDDPFYNRSRCLAPGADSHDAVIAESGVTFQQLVFPHAKRTGLSELQESSERINSEIIAVEAPSPQCSPKSPEVP